MTKELAIKIILLETPEDTAERIVELYDVIERLESEKCKNGCPYYLECTE